MSLINALHLGLVEVFSPGICYAGCIPIFIEAFSATGCDCPQASGLGSAPDRVLAARRP